MASGTIFDMVDRPARRARPYVGGEESLEKPPSQAAEGEPPVVAEPKLDMRALNYLSPRKGIDAPSTFRQCSSCVSFVPERAFRAATQGNRCVILGSFPIEPHANCSHYTPWCDGKPSEATIEAHALCCLNGSRASLTPWDVGYCSDKDHSHRCRSCRHFDLGLKPDDPGPGCELAEELNRKVPNLFMANESIDPDGGCDGWSQPVPDESNPSGQEGGL